MKKPKAGRRIMSRGEYAKAKTLAFCLTAGLFWCVAGVLWLFYINAHPPVRDFINGPDTLGSDESSLSEMIMPILVIWIGTPFLLLMSGLLCFWSLKSWYAVDTIQPIVCATTADLPAPDSLVRASQEPVQAHESVLLRAVTEEAQAGDNTQLLRASVCKVYSSGQSQID